MSHLLSTSARVRLALLLMLVLASAATIWAGMRQQAKTEPATDTPETALAELKAGNERFQKSRRTRSTDTRTDAEHRKATAKGQNPFAAVLCCADSRVVPEFLFDQGFGRIFDVSNAGNVVDGDVLGTLEYGVEHLHVRLIVVLGHKGCGAVEAVAGAGSKKLPPHLKDIQENMEAVRAEAIKVGEQKPDGFVTRMCELNAQAQAHRLLRESKVLREAVKKKETAIAVGLYDMETGVVAWSEFDPEK